MSRAGRTLSCNLCWEELKARLQPRMRYSSCTSTNVCAEMHPSLSPRAIMHFVKSTATIQNCKHPHVLDARAISHQQVV
eukprot:2726023-Pleurochrysis_carterae.AAC.6